VGVKGVRGPLDPVEGEGDAFGFSDRNHPGVEIQGALPASELLRAVLPAAHPFLRHGRVKLEGEPAHFDLPIKGGDGLLQPPLADVAPRADHIGDYVNVYDHRHPRTGEHDGLSSQTWL
jgi:hypothetical protein